MTPISKPSQLPPIKKVLIKATNKENKGKDKLFVLRDIESEKLMSCKDLKLLIKAQLKEDITESEFDVGYIHGSSVVTIRNQVDFEELWDGLRKGANTMLWCNGMQSSLVGSKRSTDTSHTEVEKKRRKTKETETANEVDNILTTLKEKHGSNFSLMQYRIWAEMHVGGYHPSIDEAPTTTMFVRAGGTTPKRRTTADAVSQAFNKLSSVLSPTGAVSQPSQTNNSHSPAKVIENRSKCYRQLGEIKNLKQSGLLSEEEYDIERGAIMGTLKSLGP